MLDANRMHAGGVLLLCIRRIGLSRCEKKASARIMIFFARFYFQLVCLLEIRSFSVVSKYLFSADFFFCAAAFRLEKVVRRFSIKINLDI